MICVNNHTFSGSTQPVQTLCALVYAAAEIGGQQFIEMIFKSSAGRIVYDFYKERPPFPEAIAREYGYEKTAIYFEEITKRYLIVLYFMMRWMKKTTKIAKRWRLFFAIIYDIRDI